MNTFKRIGYQVGQLVATKHDAYGDSIRAVEGCMRHLYPDGIAPEQFCDSLLAVRILDKLKRLATDGDALGESPYIDIAGYGIRGAELHEKRKAGPCSTSANAQDAPTSSTAPTGSAAKRAGKPFRPQSRRNSAGKSATASASVQRADTVTRTSNRKRQHGQEGR